MDDLELIKKYQAGDNEAFGEIYNRYIRKIYDFVFYRTSSRETAEDLASEIFLKAADKVKSFVSSGAGFSAWLYRIARNHLIDYYRTEKKNFNLEEIANLSDNGRWAEDEASRQALNLVKEKLASLKPEQREIIIMRVWDGLSYKEIAAISGKSEAAAKMSFSRALKILKEKLPEDLFVILLVLININLN